MDPRVEKLIHHRFFGVRPRYLIGEDCDHYAMNTYILLIVKYTIMVQNAGVYMCCFMLW